MLGSPTWSPHRAPRADAAAVTDAVDAATAALAAKTRAVQRSALAAASLGFQKGVAAQQQQADAELTELRQRIAALEARDLPLPADEAAPLDAASPLRANRPAAAVQAAALAAREAAAAHQPAIMPAPPPLPGATAASAAGALLPPPAPPPARRALSGAAIWALSQQQVASAPPVPPPRPAPTRRAPPPPPVVSEPDPPEGLQLEFLVAAHRLKCLQRRSSAFLLRSALAAWRRAASDESRRLRAARLLLVRVLRRSKAAAFGAWRDAVCDAGLSEPESDDGAAPRALPAAHLERLLRHAAPPLAAAFHAQASLFTEALEAAAAARTELQSELTAAHAAEMAALRTAFEQQTAALTLAAEAAAASLAEAQAAHLAAQEARDDARAQAARQAAEPAAPPRNAPGDAIAPPRRRADVPLLPLPLAPDAPVQSVRYSSERDDFGPSRAEALLHRAQRAPTPFLDPPSPPNSPPQPRSVRPVPELPPLPPLRPADTPSRAGGALVAVATLVIQGWTRGDATEALAACNGEAAAAARWLTGRGRLPQAAPPRLAVTPRTPSSQL